MALYLNTDALTPNNSNTYISSAISDEFYN